MVVDKDVEGLGEWTLGDRVGMYTYCIALQMEDSKSRVRLQDWSTFSAMGGS